MLYQLSIIHADQDQLATTIEERVKSTLRDVGCREEILGISYNVTPSIDESCIQCCLYIGSIQGKTQCDSLIQEIIDADIPVFPLVMEEDAFHDTVPKLLHRINALIWKGDDPGKAVALALLRNLGLTEEHRRLFISYRRADALRMAEQLYAALSQVGFDVFLDRFSIEPGEVVQEKLTESLWEKSYVLLLESPQAYSSDWIKHEVVFALKHRMGFVALTWPETISNGKLVEWIDDSFRLKLHPLDLTTRNGPVELTSSFLSWLPYEIEIAHAKAMRLRRKQLMESVQKELRRHNIKYKTLTNWDLLVETRRRSLRNDCIMHVTPRPPTVRDLFTLHTHCRDYDLSPASGILIHTKPILSEEEETLLSWLVEYRDLTLLTEDNIVERIAAIANAGNEP